MELSKNTSKSTRHGEGEPDVHHLTTIADLHETIVDHICSLLSLKDLARMSASLKSWRYLCYTCPHLILDVDKQCGNNMWAVVKLLVLMKRLLALSRPTQLERFTLTCFTFLPVCHVAKWIKYAVKCQVKELVLNLYLPSLVLPVEIFTLQSLTRLKLNMNHQYLKLPSCLGLINLRRLSLMYVKLPEDPFGDSVLTQCISLKKLSLTLCFGFNTLNIASSSLERILILDPPHEGQLYHLHISCANLDTLYIELNSPYHAQNSFKLCAPNLKNFQMRFNHVVDLYWSPMNFLKGATVGISSHNEWKVLFPFGSQLLPFFTEANELHLCSRLMQVLAWMMKEKPGISLRKIECLNIFTHLSDDEILLIIYLLRGFPKLKFLLISRDNPNINKGSSLPKELYKEMKEGQNIESVYQLRSARMSLLGTGENNLKLAKYLFNNAKGLKKFVMLHLPSDVEVAKEIGRKMKDLEKASPNVEINIKAGTEDYFL
ncbi:hypothetical protein ACHQM5_019995 [Ranunculus cassubicifolius]